MARILICDDENYVIRVLRLALESQKYEVLCAANGDEALKTLEETLPDAMVVDICMPRMDGRELCKSIQRKYPNRKFLIVVMTSHTARKEREWIKDISNIEFLEKPVSPKQLIAKLEEFFKKNGGGNTGELHA